MIVCSCNVLSDQDIRSAVEAGAPRSTSQVYGCLGCRPKCGRCAGTIRRLIDEGLGSSHFSIGANLLSAEGLTFARRLRQHAQYSRSTYAATSTT